MEWLNKLSHATVPLMVPCRTARFKIFSFFQSLGLNLGSVFEQSRNGRRLFSIFMLNHSSFLKTSFLINLFLFFYCLVLPFSVSLLLFLHLSSSFLINLFLSFYYLVLPFSVSPLLSLYLSSSFVIDLLLPCSAFLCLPSAFPLSFFFFPYQSFPFLLLSRSAFLCLPSTFPPSFFLFRAYFTFLNIFLFANSYDSATN